MAKILLVEDKEMMLSRRLAQWAPKS